VGPDDRSPRGEHRLAGGAGRCAAGCAIPGAVLDEAALDERLRRLTSLYGLRSGMRANHALRETKGKSCETSMLQAISSSNRGTLAVLDPCVADEPGHLGSQRAQLLVLLPEGREGVGAALDLAVLEAQIEHRLFATRFSSNTRHRAEGSRFRRIKPWGGGLLH
jgi:hypothetical protein